jgi:REP element-mobilizing transposase RayT
MHFTEIGEIVVDEWLKTPVIRPDMNIFLDEFVVMPDHFHGIVIIGNNRFNNRLTNVGRNAMHGVGFGRNAMHGVSTKTNTKNKFGPQVKNLSSIIRGFKSAVTVRARKIDRDFGWQSRFYDCIIRDDRSFQRIKKYIIDNPKKWKVDD